MLSIRVNFRFYTLVILLVIIIILWGIFLDKLLLGLWISIFLIILSSWLIARNSLAGIQIERFSRKRILKVGELFEERIDIANNSEIHKFWVEILRINQIYCPNKIQES